MKRLLTFLLLLIGFSAFSQTNYTNSVGAIQRKDSVGSKVFRFSASDGVKTPLITPISLKDSLKNYQQLADGLISGGTPSTYGDSLIVASGVARINGVNYNFTGKTFGDIPPSAAGLTRILLVYANTSGLLDTISGAQSNNPAPPTNPINTAKIVTVPVSDAGLGVPSSIIAGKANLDGGNSFTGNQSINGDVSITGEIGVSSNPTYPSPFTLLVRDVSTGKYGTASNADIKTYLGYISGTGTVNYIPKFLTGSSLQNSLIYDSGTNIGIGTSSPSSRLHVSNTAGLSEIRNTGGTSSYKIITGTGFSTMGTITNDPLVVVTNDIEKLRVTASGNLLIGSSTDNGTDKLQVTGSGIFSSTLRTTGLGAGIAPSANHYIASSANTSTIGSWLFTPSATDYTGTVSGTLWNNANEFKFYDGTTSSVNRFLKTNTNATLSGTGDRIITANTSGSVAATYPIREIYTTDTDVITAITGATYNRTNTFSATITPANSKIFYKGQLYKSSTYLYVATSDNVSYRTSLYGAETGWATYVDNQYTSASPFSISSGTTVTLPNNAATSITDNLPVGITALYNSSTSKITPAQSGDSYGISIRFKAKSTSASDYFDFGIDLGGSVGTVFKQTKTFTKGANTEMNFSIDLNAYAAATFFANGGLVKLTAGTGTMTVYDIIFDIFRTHKGIQ